MLVVIVDAAVAIVEVRWWIVKVFEKREGFICSAEGIITLENTEIYIFNINKK